MTVSVTRSSWLPALGALLAIPLLIIAVDLGFTYRIFPEPEEDANGVRTTQGESERRADQVWALGVGVAGLLLAGTSLRELGQPRVILSADEDQLRLDIGPRGARMVPLSWAQVATARSQRVADDFGEHRMLVLELVNADGLPLRPRGANLVGTTLEMDADSWSIPSHVVADSLAAMAARARLRAESEDR